MMRLRLAPRRRDLVCQRAVELVTDYLEGALGRADRRRFEAHLADCPDCTEYLAQMRATIALTGAISPADLTPAMRTEFVALYRRWQAEQGQPGQPRSRPPGADPGDGEGRPPS
jgi:anti-sigma factor RsiW